MKAIKQLFGGAVACLCEITVGILLLINPAGFSNIIIIVCGIALSIWGLIRIVGYFLSPPETAAGSNGLFYGLCILLCGSFCILQSEWFVALLPLVNLLYGCAILVAGLNKVQWTINLIRLKKGKWTLIAFSAIISIACSILIIKNPFTTTSMLWTFTGVILIAEAAIDIITFLFSSYKK